MKKKVVILMIQIFVVALALTLTVTTYAWYSSQSSVKVSATTVTAAAGSSTVIEDEEDIVFTPYMGQTGLGYEGDAEEGVDSPYSATRTVTVTFTPLKSGSYLTINLLSMNIKFLSGQTAKSELNPDILDCFTWRISIDDVVYGPDGNGFAMRKVGNDIVYYEINEATTLTLTFSLIFLDEESYTHHLNREYDEIQAFAYSGYENMRAEFNCVFEVGIDMP